MWCIILNLTPAEAHVEPKNELNLIVPCNLLSVEELWLLELKERILGYGKIACKNFVFKVGE
jgi:hypothetical protein